MKKCAGFTLLEVLVSLFILAVGIIGVATMQISAIRGNSRGWQISEATQVAEGLMEVLLTRDYNNACLRDANGDGLAGLDNGWSSRDFPSASGPCSTVPSAVPSGYRLFWNIAENEPTARNKTIRVFVEGPNIRTFSLQMIKADI
jgi:type IV pilus modification protein PilV